MGSSIGARQRRACLASCTGGLVRVQRGGWTFIGTLSGLRILAAPGQQGRRLREGKLSGCGTRLACVVWPGAENDGLDVWFGAAQLLDCRLGEYMRRSRLVKLPVVHRPFDPPASWVC